MSVRQDAKKRWIYDEFVKAPNGQSVRIKGRAPAYRNTRDAAAHAYRLHRAFIEGTGPLKREGDTLTFDEYFNGRFWNEWVIAEGNKPSEVKNKRGHYERHLKAEFGALVLTDITTARIATFRAKLVTKGLGKKTINNILCVLSKALNYALDVELIAALPKFRYYKIARAQIDPWEFEDYARLLATARAMDPYTYVAVCLAGEAGLRVGEVKAFEWTRADFVAKMLTVDAQVSDGVTGSPKSNDWRMVPMSSTMEQALLALPGPREGHVVRNRDGLPLTDAQADKLIERVCKRAGLPIKRWHRLRHTFATDAARFNVNAYALQAWMGHHDHDETQRYIHVARKKWRPIPGPVLDVGARISDPDLRALAMLGARAMLAVPSGTHLRLVPDQPPRIAAA